MALNRYTVLPNQQVINTHVDQNLGLMNAALATKQKSYDEAELYNQTVQDNLSKFATRDVDVARKNELVAGYQQRAQEIVQNEYDGDYSRAMPALRKLANDTSKDEYWQRATSALARQKDFYEAQKRISEKGGTTIEFNNDAVRKAVYNKDGSFNNIDYDIQERLNYAKPKLELMANIASDTRLRGLSQAQIGGVLQYGKVKGVDAGKVMAVAGQMLAPYLSTPEGMQEMRFLVTKGGLSAQDAQRYILKSLVGVGSKQIGSESDMSYMGDPNHVAKGSEKEEDITTLESTSPAVDVQLDGGLNMDMFTKKDRSGVKGAVNVQPGFAAAKVGVTYKNDGDRTPKYGSMTKEQRLKTADMIEGRYKFYAERLRKGLPLSEKGMDRVAEYMKDTLTGLGNLKVGASVRSIPADQNFGGYGKGEEGYTKALLGSDDISDISYGKMINAVIYDPETKEKMSGKDFYNKVIKKAQAEARDGKMGVKARVTGRFGATNPYSLLANDDAFGDSKQLVIGDKQYVIAGLNENSTRTVTYKDKNGNKVKQQQQYSESEDMKMLASPITKAMRNVEQVQTVTVGGKKFKMQFNKDGTFSFPEHVNENGEQILMHTTMDPETIIRSYLN